MYYYKVVCSRVIFFFFYTMPKTVKTVWHIRVGFYTHSPLVIWYTRLEWPINVQTAKRKTLLLITIIIHNFTVVKSSFVYFVLYACNHTVRKSLGFYNCSVHDNTDQIIIYGVYVGIDIYWINFVPILVLKFIIM